MNFKEYLEKQLKLHPSMQLQDIIKLCFQAVYGPEHLLADVERAKNYFMQEYEATPANFSLPLYEPVSDTFCRVNLGAWKARFLEPEELFRLFVTSATDKSSGTEADFDRCAELIDNMSSNGFLPFSGKDWKDYYATYKKDGIRPVHHSDAYRLAEHPAYRLVRTDYLSPYL